VVKSLVMFGLGRIDESLALARDAVASAPRSGRAHEALGQALLAKGDITAAFAEYTEATQLSPGASQPQFRLARLALDLGKNRMALEYAKEGVRRFPDDRQAGAMLVDALIRNGELSTADFTLRPLLARFPDSPDVLVQLGALQSARGDLRAARTSFSRVLQREPDNFDALSGLVTLDLRERAMASARRRVDEAVAARGNDVKRLMLAARVYLADPDVRRAESILRHVVAIDPSNVDAARSLADCLTGQQREAEARQVLEQLVERMPASTDAQTSLALLLERMGDIAGARARYERIVAADSRAALASRRLAALYLEHKENLDVALNLAIVAVQEMPDDPASNDLLGWIYTQKGLFINGLPHLENAVKSAPTNAVYRYHLGTAYMRTGDAARAKAELTRALEIDQTLEEAREAIARVRP
jgi:tetratricopeptide (TPR) repeat protein